MALRMDQKLWNNIGIPYLGGMKIYEDLKIPAVLGVNRLPGF
jgi:hypothetical protein